MRINHNITAMNSYRNFSANTSKLSKNLEKLSTGMKINRAGDDAAGLAISEKMRAQISGIEGATKNAKDGISLIQTAEGALTEVHDMLNRMTTLAEQSANGTYDNDVDRNQLQKEVDALKTEIDRIADSTNYNGIKLLDGSMSGAANVKGNVTMSDTVATQATSKTTVITGGKVNYGTDGKNNSITATSAGTLASGLKVGQGNDSISVNISWTEDGTTKTSTIEFKLRTNDGTTPGTVVTAGYNQDDTQTTVSSDVHYLEGADGTKYNLSEAGKLTVDDLANAINTEISKSADLKSSFASAEAEKDDNGDSTGSLIMTGKQSGSGSATLNSIDFRLTTRDSEGKLLGTSSLGATLATDGITEGKDVQQKVSLSNVKVLNGTSFAAFTNDEKQNAIRDNTFEIDGHKFLLYAADTANDVKELKEMAGSDVNIIQLDGGNKTASTSATNAATLSEYLSSGQTLDLKNAKVGATQGAEDTDKDLSTDANLLAAVDKMASGDGAKKDATTIAAELSRVTGRSFDILGTSTESVLKSSSTKAGNGDAFSFTINGETVTSTATAADGKGFAAITVKEETWDVVLSGNDRLQSEGKALELQIGDTADKFNKLSVAVEDMHSSSIGIGDVDISTQEGAAAALDQIKSAVNYVSNTRGSLGALQNRLDHTINNLGVMKENIQSAESLIRDTDVAEEMMTYTKNNILNQSAQAMLAQANQLPQGVLQLLG